MLPFGGLKSQSKDVTAFMRVANLMAMGVDMKELKKVLDPSIRAMDGWGKSPPPELANARMMAPYYGYVLGRDTSYLAWLRKWNAEVLLKPPSFQALAALDRGDTAAAQKLAVQFPRGDSARARALGGSGMLGPYLEADILTRLGDLRGALATYEAISPRRYSIFGLPDPRWPLYARSFLARGKLYEELGEREKAKAAYERFLELWSDADRRLEPQLREARDGLIRLRDAPAAQIKKTS